MNFADTNWLEAMFFKVRQDGRDVTVGRFIRNHKPPIVVSQIVALEARNVFTRMSGEPEPEEWREFQEDARFYRDPINWDLLRRDVFALIFRYGNKETFGTFDLAVLASAKLAGATRLLSFDGKLKALAAAEGLDVFPPLTDQERDLSVRLK